MYSSQHIEIQLTIQQRQDAIEQQRQKTQRAAQNLLRFQGGFSVRSLKAKNMEDQLSPKAQDQVKKSAKVKSAISDKIVEDRKRASESKQTDHSRSPHGN